MIPTVVVVLTLASSALALPLTNQQYVTTGTEGGSQIQTGNSVPQHVQKTGVQGFFEVYTQPQTGTEQAEKSTVNSGAPGQYAKVTSGQQVTQAQKSGVEIPLNVFPQNAPVSKVENVPVNVEHAQSSYSESPVLLPVHPLSAVPANQAGQVVQPVVVPVEILPSDKMILMAIDSSTIQQKNFQQDVNSVPQSQISFQKVVESVTHFPVRIQETKPNSVQPVEKQNQEYSPVQLQPNQNPLVTQQNVPVTYVAQSAVPVSNYNQAPIEPNVQVFSVQQNTQPVVADDVQKQAATGYVSAQTQFAETSVQQQQGYHAQQSVEKQESHHQRSDYTPAQNQINVDKPAEFENVLKQGQYQEPNSVHTQNADQSYEQQPQVHNIKQAVKNKVPYQQVSSEIQNQPAGQPVYNVQPAVTEKTEKLGQYQQANPQVQIESAEQQQQQTQTQTAQQFVEKQVPHQKPVPIQTYPVQLANQLANQNSQPAPAQLQSETVKPVNQQQGFGGQQPFTTGQAENQVQYQKGSHSQSVGYFAEETPQTEALRETPSKQQFFSVQPQTVVQYADDYTYAFGDKIPKVQQNAPAYVLTSVPQTQDYLVGSA